MGGASNCFYSTGYGKDDGKAAPRTPSRCITLCLNKLEQEILLVALKTPAATLQVASLGTMWQRTAGGLLELNVGPGNRQRVNGVFCHAAAGAGMESCRQPEWVWEQTLHHLGVQVRTQPGWHVGRCLVSPWAEDRTCHPGTTYPWRLTQCVWASQSRGICDTEYGELINYKTSVRLSVFQTRGSKK